MRVDGKADRTAAMRFVQALATLDGAPAAVSSFVEPAKTTTSQGR